jgi:hypothetical protein
MAAIASPTATKAHARRTRPGEIARETITTSGSANSQPRLCPSSAVAASTVASARNRPRSSGCTSRRTARIRHGQKPMNQIATVPFGYWSGQPRRPLKKTVPGLSASPALARATTASAPIAAPIPATITVAPRRPSGQSAKMQKTIT